MSAQNGQLSEADYCVLCDFLRSHMGYELGAGKEYLVDSRLAPLAATLELPDVSSLIGRLRSGGDAATRDMITDAMAINETYFFRAPRTFETLRERMIPALKQARADTRRLRIWCAACSTGQEPYSIAMTLADHFPDLSPWNIEIIATDISEQSLERARRGTYNQFEVQRGLPVQSLLKHFTKTADSWQISAAIRRAVEFRKFNLLDPPYCLGEPFDIVLIRNVLIYFDRSMLTEMFAKLRRTIASDGFLLLGESESIIGLTDDFVIPPGAADYYSPL